MTDPVGKARIEIEADTSGVRKGVEDAKDAVEGLGDASDKATTKIGSGVGRATEAFKKLSGAVTSVVGSVTALIGVFALLLRSQEQLNKLFGDGAERAQEFSNQIGYATEIQEAEKLARAVEDQALKVKTSLSFWIQLREELGAFGDGSGIIATRIRSITEEIEALEGRSQSIRDQISILRNQAAKEQAEDEAKARRDVFLSEAQDLLNQEADIRERILRESLTEEERITRDAMLRISDIRNTALQSGADASGLIRAIEEETRLRVEAHRKQKAEEDKIAKESNDKIAKDLGMKVQRELERAYEQAASTLNNTLAASFGSFNNLSDAARDIANAIERRSR